MSHENNPQTLYQELQNHPEFLKLKESLLTFIEAHTKKASTLKPSSPELQKQFAESLQTLAKNKGRDPYFSFLSSGIGSGAYTELTDGSVKLDLITGIGVHFFGHSHPELMNEILCGVTNDIMQGNLQPGIESADLIQKILSLTGEKSKLKHGWLLCSGTMANETALKIIRQKKYPATRMFAFKECFAGRSTAMQEITDNPKYREGQPTYGEITHLPFYDEDLGLEKSLEIAFQVIETEMTRYPDKYAGMMIELVQGEGGIRFAPREYYVRLFEFAKKKKLIIWDDEVQTFGRTTSLFAYQTFQLEEYIDIVTVGKLLQACMTLYSEEMNPKAGLVAGTFTGSFAALRTGRKILEILSTRGYYGENGIIAKRSETFVNGLKQLKAKYPGKIGVIRALGGMIGFQVGDGSAELNKKFLLELFNEGVVAFNAGHGPYVVRVLPPFGVMTDEDIHVALEKIEIVLKKI